MSNSIEKNPQSEIIKFLRFPLIILIVYIHSYGNSQESIAEPLICSGMYEIVRTVLSKMIAHLAVPSFFFISGFLMFYNVGTFTKSIYLQKIKKRITTLLIPYLIWNLIALLMWFFRLYRDGSSIGSLLEHYYNKGLFSCFWIFNKVGDSSVDWFGNVTYLTGPSDLPLWYLRDLIVISILSPIVYYLIKKLGLLIILFFSLIFISGLLQNVPGLSSLSLFFYSFGAYFSITKTDFSLFFRQYAKVSYLLYIVLLIMLVLLYDTLFFMYLFPLFRLVGVFVVFGIADKIIYMPSIQKTTSLFAESTFFIYAVHYVFFISFVDRFFEFLLPSDFELTHTLQYILSPLFRVCFYVAVYFFLKRLFPKMVSVMVGKR